MFDLDADPLDAPPVATPGGESLPQLRVLLASPRGFCAGVRRAIDAVRDALRLHGAPVYVRRPIVHNMAVVRALEAEGAVFVEELDAVPPGGVVILSAHGVEPAILRDAARRGLVAYDAVCPLVAKVHREVERHHASGRHVVLLRHAGHPEIAGTLGHVPPGAATLIRSPADVAALGFEADAPLALAVQTTYAVDEAQAVREALEARFPNLSLPPSEDICYATTNRQNAVREVARRADAVVIVGEGFSSNANRLRDVAAAAGCTVQLVAEPADLDWDALPSHGTLGLGAAASTPDEAIDAVLASLAARFALTLETVSAAVETVRFKRLPVG